MDIVTSGKKYRIVGGDPAGYFMKKYKTPNPEIVIEGPSKEVLGNLWSVLALHGNMACCIFALRMIDSGYHPSDKEINAENVYYGHMDVPGYPSFGELVLKSELEEIEEGKGR